MRNELERQIKNEQRKNETDLEEALLRVWQRCYEEISRLSTKSIK